SSLQQYVADTDNAALRELLRDCGGRCCAFNNRAGGAEWDAQAGDLLALVQQMLGGDLSTHYTNKLYSQATQLLGCNDMDFEEKCKRLAEQV
ncbi:GIMA1 GTPase, partial [Anseranas semipalmata]|nr:GIMA1 GTPase [Anseranas semipalmata]